ncbi:MAG TPA: NUDIX domain-containing protein [Acetobacteraceae bacterium]|jgi:8-oxo-dGTP pyrophosphatase MutT (NUDIX family)|nr:NUDIX domain-containing protein [Acetobacteraceae bacterium]
MPHVTSCGVLVTDRQCLLLGHATHSPRWDIPKGIAEPGEDFRTAAARELEEETGLVVAPNVLRDLGVHRYMPGKDLALFVWTPPGMPQPEILVCRSMFPLASGAMVPEFDKFGVFDWGTALGKVGKNMARVLTEIRELLAPTISGA